MTPEYIVRGTHLVPRSDLESVYTLSATRPNCEVPMYPAYGSIFSTGTGCGCDWYLPGSAFAFHRARKVTPMPDSARLEVPTVSSTIAGPVHHGVMGTVINDMAWTADPGAVSKANRWVDFGRTREGGDLREAFGRNIEHGKFYTVATTPPVAHEDMTLIARVRDHVLVAKRGHDVQWTFVAPARITVEPRLRGGRAYVGCNDGRVYALNLDDGTVAWQYHAAPERRYMVAFGAVESVWSVFGVLIDNDTVYCQAGRATAVDEGLWFSALDASTGSVK